MPRHTPKQLLRKISLIALFTLIALYGLWQARDLLFGISLSVEGLANGSAVTEPVLALHGSARHATEIKINGNSIPPAQDGSWSTQIALVAGTNRITIEARNKFNRTTTKNYEIFYQEPAPVPTPAPTPDQTPTNSKDTPITSEKPASETTQSKVQ
jgi:hypothetical protein